MANNITLEEHLESLASAAQQFALNKQRETISILTEAFQIAGESNFTFPVAGTSTLGMVKVGAGLSMAGDGRWATVSGGSANSIVLSNNPSTVNGAMWLDSLTASTAGEAITLPTLMPATVVNGSMWLVL